jgi:hypothetical protein
MMGSASLPSHLDLFLRTMPDLGSASVLAPPDITLVRKLLAFSLLKAAVMVATTDLLGLTAIRAGNPKPRPRDLSISSWSPAYSQKNVNGYWRFFFATDLTVAK